MSLPVPAAQAITEYPTVRSQPCERNKVWGQHRSG